MIKWLKKLFKKEENVDIKVVPAKPKMDLSEIKFHLNIKSICYFERFTGKSFYAFDEEDIMKLLYSIFIVNNPKYNISFDAFNYLLKVPEISKYLSNNFVNCTNIMQQLPVVLNGATSGGNNEMPDAKIQDFVVALITDYGLDAHYVMYEMDLWELTDFFNAIESNTKKEMLDKRFWTYLQIMPHIDTKKCKSPEELLPFEWEKETIKKRKEDDLNKNMYAIKNMIGKSIFGNKDEGQNNA